MWFLEAGVPGPDGDHAPELRLPVAELSSGVPASSGESSSCPCRINSGRVSVTCKPTCVSLQC